MNVFFCFQGETYKSSKGSGTEPVPRDGGEMSIHLGMYAIKNIIQYTFKKIIDYVY